jgi:hypothetical protein
MYIMLERQKKKAELLAEIIKFKEQVIRMMCKSSPDCDVTNLMNEIVGMSIVHRAHQKGCNLKSYIEKYCGETPVDMQNKSFVIGVYTAEKVLS